MSMVCPILGSRMATEQNRTDSKKLLNDCQVRANINFNKNSQETKRKIGTGSTQYCSPKGTMQSVIFIYIVSNNHVLQYLFVKVCAGMAYRHLLHASGLKVICNGFSQN